MKVFELKAEIPTDAAAVIEEFLAEREEQRFMVVEDKPSGRAWLHGYFESADEAEAGWSELAASFPAPWAQVRPVVQEMPDANWKDSYKIHFKAWKFGPLNWVPVWERESFSLPADEAVLWLDPGMAFGTGNHETTRLCCERLVKFAGHRDRRSRIIDAGCGSGILALSAAKLGFSEIDGFDNDPESIRVSQENAALNDLAGRVDFFVGDLVTGLAGRSGDLVLANIQADILVRFVRELSTAVKPGGMLVLSGILSQELDHVRSQFSAANRDWSIESRVLGEWSDLALTRPV